MGIIKYDANTIIEAQKKIDIYNEQILETLKTIYHETETISNILDTPKSNKNIAEFLEYLNSRITYVGNSKASLNTKLTTIETIYKEDYLKAVSDMVGGNNE